jgi:hypothetical protein
MQYWLYIMGESTSDKEIWGYGSHSARPIHTHHSTDTQWKKNTPMGDTSQFNCYALPSQGYF